MASTKLILSVAGVSAVLLLLRGDVRLCASIAKRNIYDIRLLLRQEFAAAARMKAKATKCKELPKKELPKDDPALAEMNKLLIPPPLLAV